MEHSQENPTLGRAAGPLATDDQENLVTLPCIYH